MLAVRIFLMKELGAVGINQRVAPLPAAGQPGLELEGSREGRVDLCVYSPSPEVPVFGADGAEQTLTLEQTSLTTAPSLGLLGWDPQAAPCTPSDFVPVAPRG